MNIDNSAADAAILEHEASIEPVEEIVCTLLDIFRERKREYPPLTLAGFMTQRYANLEVRSVYIKALSERLENDGDAAAA